MNEQAFCLMKLNRLDISIEIADEHLSALLHIPTPTFTLNIPKLSAAVSSTVCHSRL
jgi:hypothetical protein